MVKANVQAIDQLDAEQLGSGMVITDRQLSIVAVSEPTPRWLGFAKNELVGRPVGVLFSAEWSAALLDGIAEAVKNGRMLARRSAPCGEKRESLYELDERPSVVRQRGRMARLAFC